MSDAGRVVLITGASSGIGEALTRAFVADGHRVALLARSADRLDPLAGELGTDTAIAVPGDVTSFDDQQHAVDTAVERFGHLDVAIANAGSGTGGGFLDPDTDVEAWREIVLTNVYGVALTARAVLPHLVDAGGHLVLMGRSPAASRSKARCTRPPSGRSRGWRRRSARSCTPRACVSP